MLGSPDSDDRNVPTLLMQNNDIKNTGNLYVFGNNEFGQLGLGDEKYLQEPTLLMQYKGVRHIRCNMNYTMICKNNGELLGFGRL
jgi:alpha-tubulin suppressor-like RCC1 family protein